jgi:hypothetical protein
MSRIDRVDYYKGRGEHSVNQLEAMVEQRNEAIILVQEKVYRLEDMVRKYEDFLEAKECDLDL